MSVGSNDSEDFESHEGEVIVLDFDTTANMKKVGIELILASCCTLYACSLLRCFVNLTNACCVALRWFTRTVLAEYEEGLYRPLSVLHISHLNY